MLLGTAGQKREPEADPEPSAQRLSQQAISASLPGPASFSFTPERGGQPQPPAEQWMQDEEFKTWVLAQLPYLSNSGQVTLSLCGLVSLMIDNINWGHYKNQSSC